MAVCGQIIKTNLQNMTRAHGVSGLLEFAKHKMHADWRAVPNQFCLSVMFHAIDHFCEHDWDCRPVDWPLSDFLRDHQSDPELTTDGQSSQYCMIATIAIACNLQRVQTSQAGLAC